MYTKLFCCCGTARQSPLVCGRNRTMYIIFKLKARLLPSPFAHSRHQRLAATANTANDCVAEAAAIASLIGQRHYRTAIRACVCVYSKPLFDPDLCGGNGLCGGQAPTFTADPDDEEALCYWDADSLWGSLTAGVSAAFALLCEDGGEDAGEGDGRDETESIDAFTRAMQRAEVQHSCGMSGMSVGALEEMWMERIETELVKIGKRRRRRKRLGHLPKDTSYLGHYEVLPIHKCPDLVSQCCRLVNAEWPRSEVARMRSLQASSDSLPTNLVLTRDYRETVLAHVKLSPIPSRPNACFIESMVVRKQLRGQGLGKLLMKYAEAYATDYLRCDEMYLSTIDAVEFYEKLLYELCQPVNMYGLSMGYVPASNNKQKVYMKKMLK